MPDPADPGHTRPRRVVVEPGKGTVYGDEALCADTIAAAGFDRINFGGGMGRQR